MKVQFNLIYGGAFSYNKKDANGNKTNDKATSYILLERDDDKGIVNTSTYFLAGDFPIKTEGLELLKPVSVTLDMSATNNFKTLIDLKPIVEVKK